MADLQVWPLDTPDTPVCTVRAHPSAVLCPAAPCTRLTIMSGFGWLSSASNPNTLVVRTPKGRETAHADFKGPSVILLFAGIQTIALDHDEAIAAHLDRVFDDEGDNDQVPGVSCVNKSCLHWLLNSDANPL